MTQALLSARDLTIGYGSPLLPAVNFQVRPGELWAVVGRNGSGKTTLFRTLLGLHAPLGGHIDRAAGMLPAYVPQRAALDPIVPLRVREVVAAGVDRDWSFLAERFASRRAVVDSALAGVGVSQLSEAQFHELSEGQKQKVMLARVLAARANVAFLDEPTAAMDAVAERESLEAIDLLRREHGMAVVIVSHFLPTVRKIADHVLFLDRELNTAISGAPEEIFHHPAFQQRYGEA